MNIRKLIAEEVRQVLAEEGDLLGALEALPEEEIEAALSKLLPVIEKGLPEYVAPWRQRAGEPGMGRTGGYVVDGFPHRLGVEAFADMWHRTR